MTDFTKYDQTFYEDPEGIIQAENLWLERIIQALDLRGKRCLDLGCGSGYWAPFYLAQGAQVVGVDISEASIKYCQSLYPDGQFYTLLPGGQIPLPPGSVDIVVATWVLQEIYQKEMFEMCLSQIGQILKRPGQFLVVSNVYPDDRQLVEVTAGGHLFANDDPPLIRLFPDNSLGTIMEPLGFQLADRTCCGWTFHELYSC